MRLRIIAAAVLPAVIPAAVNPREVTTTGAAATANAAPAPAAAVFFRIDLTPMCCDWISVSGQFWEQWANMPRYCRSVDRPRCRVEEIELSMPRCCIQDRAD